MNYYRHGPQRPSGVGIGVPGMTPMMKKIIIVTGGVWLVQLLCSFVGFDLARGMGWLPGLGAVPSQFIYGAIYQPLTYIFLHSPVDPMHILFNMVMLWMFGSSLERYWGARAFLRFYLVCGVGGGVAAIAMGLWTGHASAPTIGASGALFGLFVAFGIVFAKRTVLFMLIFPMQARVMAAIMIGLNLFYLLNSRGDGVSYIAHLGGALTGYLYLKRAWRIGEFYRELRWKIKRRRFKVMSSGGHDEYLH